MINQNKQELTLRDWLFHLLKTHKKTGDGFGNCISGFWDDKSIDDLAEIIDNKYREEGKNE